MFEERNQDRGQVGIGTLIVFIAMVLVAAIAAGVLINTAGFLQSKSEETGQQSGEQVTNRLQVLSSSGIKTQNDNVNATYPNLGAVELISTKAPGAEDLDLSGITMQWVDDSGTYDIVHEDAFTSGRQDGAFGQVAVKDADNSIGGETPVINNPDDRARIVIDIGQSDSVDPGNSTDGEGDQNVYQAYDLNFTDENTIRQNGLEEGSSAQIRITTASGSASTVRITVPESLSGKTAVRV